MEKENIKKLNCEVIKYETHRNITLLWNAVVKNTEFHRFTDCSMSTASFVLKDIEESEHLRFTYDYITGTLKCHDSDAYIEINGLLSNRHLCSILVYAHDFAFQTECEMNEITTFVRKTYPIPEVWTNVEDGLGHHKHRFKIDNIISISSSCIVMDGILTDINSTYFTQPVLAKLKFSCKKECYHWQYYVNGGVQKFDTLESYDSGAKCDIRLPNKLFDEMAKLGIAKRNEKDAATNYSESERKFLQKTSQSLFFVGNKPTPLGTYDCFYARITGIKSTSEDIIAFKATYGEVLDGTLNYDVKNNTFTVNPKAYTGMITKNFEISHKDKELFKALLEKIS